MSVILKASGGGSVTLQEPSTASDYTLSLPAANGTVLTTASTLAGTQSAMAFISTATVSGTVANIEIDFDTTTYKSYI
ncbi:MAG: hypothetical protein EBV82_09195, partial [Chitinophagia bacterium]|nr:hypothetical protein [Chitinophagia bacterium]